MPTPDRIAMLFDIPPLTRRQWTVLTLVALAALFGAYDLALLQLALPQIAADLMIPAAQLSVVGALIKLGPLPAFLFTLAADRWGRRPLLTIALVAFTGATVATAFSTTVTAFVWLQFVARLFVTVVATVAGVYIVEEFPTGARGWGIGVFTGLSTVGGGLAALVFAAVHRLPFGWRSLYLIGAIALLFLPLWLLYLPETNRFARRQVEEPRTDQQLHLQPLLRLLHSYPGRLLILGGIIVCFNFGGDAALFYDPTYLQVAHNWQPWQVSLLNLSAGFMAPLGSIMAGRLSDGVGRKRVVVYFLLAMPLAIVGYYNVGGWLLPIFWSGLLVSTIGAAVILSAIGSELFPTSVRATATGVIAGLATVSGALSLAVHGLLVELPLTPWAAASWLALLIVIVPLMILALPETSGKVLEEIAPESSEG